MSSKALNLSKNALGSQRRSLIASFSLRGEMISSLPKCAMSVSSGSFTLTVVPPIFTNSTPCALKYGSCAQMSLSSAARSAKGALS